MTHFNLTVIPAQSLSRTPMQGRNPESPVSAWSCGYKLVISLFGLSLSKAIHSCFDMITTNWLWPKISEKAPWEWFACRT